MLRLFSAVGILLSLNLASMPGAALAAGRPAGSHLVRVIVRLDGQPTAADAAFKVRDRATRFRDRIDVGLPAAQQYVSELAAYQKQELSYIRSRGIGVQVGRTYQLAYNGFSALVPANQIAALRALPNVATVLPDRLEYPMDEHSNQLIHGPEAWNLVGGSAGAGRGTYIADVDSGIDMTNPCFKDTGFAPSPYGRRADTTQNYALTNNKVIVVRAYGANPGQRYTAVDQNGHGTFTSAIEVCDYNTKTPLGTISGVAPGAYLMVYDVSADRPDGVSTDSADITAFEAVLQDHADVVNFSAGSPAGAGDEREDPLAQVIDLETRAGLTFVVSAGNAGPVSQTVSSPSTANSAISVGASTNSEAVAESVDVSGAGLPLALGSLRAIQSSHPFDADVGPAAIVPAGYGRLPGDDSSAPTANDFAGKDFHGKIALIERGGEGGVVTFDTKVLNAASAGAIGAVVWDNRTETVPPVMFLKTATLPAMAISKADGEALIAWLHDHQDVTLTMNPTKMLEAETANVLSDFSSRGYGPSYRIKPDLVAPGQDIYSATEATVPGGEQYDPSGFSSGDGTSFSAPHVTGAVALLLQRHPTLAPADVRALLKETAVTGSITDPTNPTLSVMDVGSGLLDVKSALDAHAVILPDAASVGQANVGYGPQQQTVNLTLNDLGGGAGSWTASVQQIHSTSGLSVTVPQSVTLASGGHASLALHLTEAAGTAIGDYDGYVVFQSGANALHIPYFVHIANKAVASGSVLLVDATSSRFQSPPGKPPVTHVDVSQYYINTLQALHLPFTLWDDGLEGAPSLTDMKRASVVIYFTGANLAFYDPNNDNYEALDGPLSSIDLSSLESYLQGGGKLFISGKTAALSDTVWDALVLGSAVGGFSEYDNARNDPKTLANVSPPSPSAVPDKRQFVSKNPWMFSGMRALDFSLKVGDGARDNFAIHSPAAQAAYDQAPPLVGVTDVSPYYDDSPKDAPYNGYGRAVLRTTDLSHRDGAGDVAVANSDEPSLKLKATYTGRSVLFTFGFEGINDNTGYATRVQVMRRVFAWFDDKPSASVAPVSYRSHISAPLRATFKTLTGFHAVAYQWQVGGTTLKATSTPTLYSFPHAGTFKLRVQVTDSLGHVAVSGWKLVTVR